MTLFAEVRNGSSAAVPLVLLHGFGGGAFVWRTIVERLDPAQPLLLYDLPGHSRSFAGPGIGHAGAMARAIRADLDARGVDDFHLGGHSMGGAVASLIALRVPERTRSLTLLSPGGFGPDIDHEALRRYGSAQTTAELLQATARMMAPGAVANAEDLASCAVARQFPGATDALIRILSSILVERDGVVGQGMLPLDALGRLGVPTWLVWGGADPILPMGQARNAWPGTHLRRIEGAGHMLMDEAPEAVADVILAALAGT